MPKRLDDDRPAFPLEVGAPVGWQGARWYVAWMPRDPKTSMARITDKQGQIRKVWITELTDPPPLPDHIREAADGLSAFLANPQAIFEEEV